MLIQVPESVSKIFAGFIVAYDQNTIMLTRIATMDEVKCDEEFQKIVKWIEESLGKD